MNNRSVKRLGKTHPALQLLLTTSANESTGRLEIGETLRTAARQKELFESGASKTMNSRHLSHPLDGLSYAADIVLYVGGAVSWDWPLFFDAARHIQNIAQRLGIRVTWGGAWDCCLNDLSDDLEKEVSDYVVRAKLLGIKKPLIDGPHFQLAWDAYP